MSRRRTCAERAQATAARDTRRTSLRVLLARIEHGLPLTGAEAEQLRAHVEAEIAEGDHARRTAAGQEAAMRREQQRTAAAEVAIVEAEEHAAAVEEERDRALAAWRSARRRTRA